MRPRGIGGELRPEGRGGTVGRYRSEPDRAAERINRFIYGNMLRRRRGINQRRGIVSPPPQLMNAPWTFNEQIDEDYVLDAIHEPLPSGHDEL